MYFKRGNKTTKGPCSRTQDVFTIPHHQQFVCQKTGFSVYFIGCWLGSIAIFFLHEMKEWHMAYMNTNSSISSECFVSLLFILDFPPPSFLEGGGGGHRYELEVLQAVCQYSCCPGIAAVKMFPSKCFFAHLTLYLPNSQYFNAFLTFKVVKLNYLKTSTRLIYIFILMSCEK